MSTHSYFRLWIHLIWETLGPEPMLDKGAAAKASAFLNADEYAIFVKRYGLEMAIGRKPLKWLLVVVKSA